jgi:hypothetical protein
MSKTDREICEAATPGPWKRYTLLSGAHEVCVDGNYARGGICVPIKEVDADFIAHFNPAKVRRMVDALEIFGDALAGFELIERGGKQYFRLEVTGAWFQHASKALENDDG